MMELSDATQAGIAKELRIPVSEVKDAVKAAMADDLVALNHLWRSCYLSAVQGNTDAQQLTLRIAEFRQDLTAEMRTHRFPMDVQPSEDPPTVAVRKAFNVLAGNAEHVAQTLVDIALHGKNEGVRVTASIAIMDRVGLGRVERSEIAVHLLDSSAPDGDAPLQAGQLVRQRLAAIAARKKIVTIDAE